MFKMNVILDLDNTLINALSSGDRRKLPNSYSEQFNYVDYIPFFRIYERPHLQDFLDFLFANFNVAVITAAERDYAMFIVDRFILSSTKIKNGKQEIVYYPNRKLDFIFFSYQVDIGMEIYKGIKNLNMLWDTMDSTGIFRVDNYYPSNTIIVDDLDEVSQTNPYNSIRLKNFSVVNDETGEIQYDAINDDELLKIKEYLINVREKFNKTTDKWSDIPLLKETSVSE